MPKIYANAKLENEDEKPVGESALKAVRKIVEKIPVRKNENAGEDER